MSPAFIILLKHNTDPKWLEFVIPEEDVTTEFNGQQIISRISQCINVPEDRMKLVCKGKLLNAESIMELYEQQKRQQQQQPAKILVMGAKREDETGCHPQDILVLMGTKRPTTRPPHHHHHTRTLSISELLFFTQVYQPNFFFTEQRGVDRDTAIRALRKNNFDLIDAIRNL
eukprot:GEZU01013236.1.p1 GENE.GEZU01013236.1~~GEZU01013236.1.p1  ORF type:complete len:172 (+),score=28.15 GEZU01013236.1:52-567(+)